jgi:hypothetical protein
MTTKRRWTEFPVSLIELIQKFEDTPSGRLASNNLSKSDAYSIRNEFHRFRRAVADAIERGDESSILQELHATLKDMSLTIHPLTPGSYQVRYNRHIITRKLLTFEAYEPLVDTEEPQV